ncbi:MAG: efflux RND transporter periplasmic adaptor subunit [Holophaga sp.]|nr:efflux RND transporter periplasmic adaptor subunit [Holophaga sp.]
MKRATWMGLTVALVVIAGGTALALRGNREVIHWRSAKVDRGGITQRVTATGTLNALIQVPVGTQVSGVVTSLTADFSSVVKKGQVIGQIDPTPSLTALKSAQATLQSATATKANAEIVYKRNLELWKEKLISDNDLDGFRLSLQVASASVETARAGLQTAKTNLGYCTIKAPVDGVVVSRLVDVGQTVAASFSTPNVFTIAQDLAKMKVYAAIDEADIGQVRVGQRAFFTVESYPDKQFKGVVSEVQLNPVITNNVVTYNVVMEVENEPRTTYASGSDRPRPAPGAAPAPRKGASLALGQKGTLEYTTARYMPPGSPVYNGNLALFPGMTADCSIITNRREDVLRVPSAAIRFNPASFISVEELKPGPQRPAGGPSSVVSRGLVARHQERLWVLANGKPRPVMVKTGVSDGMFTEVSGDGVSEGMPVLTGVEDYKKAASAPASPLGGGGMRH